MRATGKQPPGGGRTSRQQAGSAQPRQTLRDVGTRPSACLRHQEVAGPLGKTSSGSRHKTRHEARGDDVARTSSAGLGGSVASQAAPGRHGEGGGGRRITRTAARCARTLLSLVLRARATDATGIAKSNATLRLAPGRAEIGVSRGAVSGRPVLRGRAGAWRRRAAAARPLALCDAPTAGPPLGVLLRAASDLRCGQSLNREHGDYVMVSSCRPRHTHPDTGILFALYEGRPQSLHCFPCYT